MRMFSVADQRSIPEIAVDCVIAVPCRELLLTDDVRGRAAELAAEHPVQENSVPGSVPDMLAKLAEGIPVDGMEALLPVLRPTDLSTLTDHLPAGHPAAGLRPREGPHPRRRPDQDRPRVPRGVVVDGGGRRRRADRSRGAGRVGVRRTRRRSIRGARRRAPVVDAEPACPTSRRWSSTSGRRRRRGVSSPASTRSSRCCAPTSRPAATPRSSPPAPAPRTASSSNSPNPTLPQPFWNPAPPRRTAWSGCSRARCTTVS